MKNLFCATVILLISFSSHAITELILDPSPQATSNTCQSYSIAFSLAQSGLWPETIESPKQLRALEQRVRTEINLVAKQDENKTPYHHDVWAKAVKRVSSNNLKLKRFYTESPNAYYKKIASITGMTSSEILSGPISALLVKAPIMTSVTTLENNDYADGHIITILGLTEDVPKNRSLASMNQNILALNSAVKSGAKTFNICSEDITSGDKKYSASLSLATNYKVKQWGAKYLLMWIEKN